MGSTINTSATVDGRVLARDGAVTLDSNTITAAVCATPLINIVKVPSPLSLPDGPGSVTYNYTVTNPGVVAMSNITVADDTCSPAGYISGDTDADNRLDTTETWSYDCTMALSTTTTNTVTATGLANGFTATDTANATVVVGSAIVPPLINIVKTPNILIASYGGTVIYTYRVNNPGTVALNDVSVTDNKCAPLSSPSGDSNTNNLLDVSETWVYTCQTTLTATTTNTATATGSANSLTATDTSTATVVVVPATISIAAIGGLTAPVTGATPVTTITQTLQYTGTVTWLPTSSPFASATVYTAYIILTPKTGYTCTGVGADLFTVAGTSSPATNTPNSCDVTAVFPATAPSVMTGTVSITGNAKFGQLLTANLGLIYTPWTTDVPTYQWLRGGEEIDSAIASTYTLGVDDITNTISVKVTADGTHATGNVTSDPTTVVTQAQLTIAAPTVTTTKPYDGNTSVAVCTSGELSGIVGSEVVTATCVATYTNATVGTGKTITVVYTLGGIDAAKYVKPVDYTVATGVVTTKLITVTATANQTKVYGTADPTFAYTVAPDLIGSDAFTGVLARAVGTDVGTYAINQGTLANSNYAITFEAANFSITAKPLTIAAPAVTPTKPYDGNAIVAICTPGALTGIVGVENVTATCVATYADATVGTGKTINVVYTLGGTDLANYIKPVDGSITADITIVTINIAAIPGVTAPVTGATPVLTITATAQYTGTVTWLPTGIFASATVYTAYITLTPTTGYTCAGVGADLFIVAGTSTPTTNAPNLCVVTAVFPATATTIDKAALTAAIDFEYSDGDGRTTLKFTSTDYTVGTWNNYIGAIDAAIDIESSPIATQAEIIAETSVIDNAIAALVLKTPLEEIGAITGTSKIGQTLTAGALTPSGATVDYQWSISDTTDGDYSNIDGATADTYVILAANVGKYLKIEATGTGDYSGTVRSAATAVAPLSAPTTVVTVPNLPNAGISHQQNVGLGIVLVGIITVLFSLYFVRKRLKN